MIPTVSNPSNLKQPPQMRYEARELIGYTICCHILLEEMDGAFSDANADDSVRLWRKQESAITKALPSLGHFSITRTFTIEAGRSIGSSFFPGFRVFNCRNRPD